MNLYIGKNQALNMKRIEFSMIYCCWLVDRIGIRPLQNPLDIVIAVKIACVAYNLK